jgi:hypothetical protein
MKIPLKKDTQQIILLMQKYQEFNRIYYYGILKNDNYDWYGDAQRFYYTLPLPEGLNTSDYCFDAILRYPVDKTMNTPKEDLPKLFTFEY